MSLRPLSTVRVSSHQIGAHRRFPNTSIQRRPLLIYKSAFPASANADSIEAHLRGVGATVPNWRFVMREVEDRRFSMYKVSHFHSIAHELLCVSSGSGRMLFGGEGNPTAVETDVARGDVILVPAGVCHRFVHDLGDDYEMVGAYPPPNKWDVNYGKEGEKEADIAESIRRLTWFDKDPLYGDQGPAVGVNTT